jgi:hypothetical protein
MKAGYKSLTDQDVCKTKSLAIYLRDDLGNAYVYFIMLSALQQFEHIAKSKCETTIEIQRKC